MSAATTRADDYTPPKFYQIVTSLPELAGADTWREVAVLPVRLRQLHDTWFWHLDYQDVDVLRMEQAAGRIVTMQHRGPDGKMRLLARRVPVKHQNKFRSDAHMRDRGGNLRDYAPYNRKSHSKKRLNTD